jgi:hypothetical protein
MEDDWLLNFILYFMGTTCESLHLLLDKWSMAQYKVMDILTNVIWIGIIV